MDPLHELIDEVRRAARAADWGVYDDPSRPEALSVLCILASERTQTVTCTARSVGARRLLEITSPAGTVEPNAKNLSRLLRHQAGAERSRYDLSPDCEVTARATLDLAELAPQARTHVVGAVLREVAHMADSLEEELTGLDEL